MISFLLLLLPQSIQEGGPILRVKCDPAIFQQQQQPCLKIGYIRLGTIGFYWGTDYLHFISSFGELSHLLFTKAAYRRVSAQNLSSFSTFSLARCGGSDLI